MTLSLDRLESIVNLWGWLIITDTPAPFYIPSDVMTTIIDLDLDLDLTKREVKVKIVKASHNIHNKTSLGYLQNVI